MTEQNKVVARVVPAMPVPQPDFLARAKAVWGEQPPGKPLSEVVGETRGELVHEQAQALQVRNPCDSNE